MTTAVGMTLIALAGHGGWRLWLLHRAVISIRSQMSRFPARVDGELRRLRTDVAGLEAQHAEAVEVRMRRAEAAVAQIAREHGQLARHVAWMAPWVQYWASDETGAPKG